MTTLNDNVKSQSDNRPMLAGFCLLILGLVIGLTIGPWGLGNAMPERYDAWFPNPPSIQTKLEDIEKSRKFLTQTDVSTVAILEFDQQRQSEIDVFKEQLQTADARVGLMHSLLLASLVVLAVMSLASRQSVLFSRLHLASHLFLGSGLAMLIAQPYLFSKLSGKLLLGCVAITFVICLIPSCKTKVIPAELEHD